MSAVITTQGSASFVLGLRSRFRVKITLSSESDSANKTSNCDYLTVTKKIIVNRFSFVVPIHADAYTATICIDE